jgi:hypothetical protein
VIQGAKAAAGAAKATQKLKGAKQTDARPSASPGGSKDADTLQRIESTTALEPQPSMVDNTDISVSCAAASSLYTCSRRVSRWCSCSARCVRFPVDRCVLVGYGWPCVLDLARSAQG